MHGKALSIERIQSNLRSIHSLILSVLFIVMKKFSSLLVLLCLVVFIMLLACSHDGEAYAQGWRSDESASVPPMCLRFDSRTRRHMGVEFVVGSLLCSERFFSEYSGFSLSSKTNISKFQFDLDVRHLIMSLWLR